MTTATSRAETPIYFPAGGETLFGLVTRPTAKPRGVAFIVLSGGATPISSNRNQLSVRLCRRLAERGFHAFRFDYHGAGESTGAVAEVRLDRGHVEDLMGAIAWLRASEGVERFVLAGSCFGARTALSAAPSIEGLHGVAFAALAMQDEAVGEAGEATAAREWKASDYARKVFRVETLKGLFDRRRRRMYVRYLRRRIGVARSRRAAPRGAVPTFASETVTAPLRTLAERGVPVLLLYGERDRYYREFVHEREHGEIGSIVRAAGDRCEVQVLPGKVHGFTTLDVQDEVLARVERWMLDLAPEPVGAEREGRG